MLSYPAAVDLSSRTLRFTELVDLLAATAPDLADAVQAAARKAYVVLDGTLISIDRSACAPRPTVRTTPESTSGTD